MKIVIENKNKGTINVDDQEIDGFIDDEKLCPTCLENSIYYDDYDSFVCPQCNIWLDFACGDSTCEYCRNRPEKPFA